MKKRISIKPTYDSVRDGLQYHISSFVNHKVVADQDLTDPFVNHKIHISLLDVIKGLFKGGIEVTVNIRGNNPRIEEDVLELDNQTLSLYPSTRREEFNKQVFEYVDLATKQEE